MLQNNKLQDIRYHIIDDIFSGEYRTHLALRGNVVSYFLYNLNHFSMDLSIEIVRTIPDESRFQVYIESLFATYGKVIQISRIGDTFYFTLVYGDGGANIIIEIYTKIWTENQYEIASIYGLELLAQERSTIFANQLVDSTVKKVFLGRDLYDIYFYFLHQFPINELLIQQRTSKNLREYLIYLLEFLDQKINPENLLVGFEEFIDSEQRVFVQEKLLSELTMLVQSKISGIR